MTVSFTGLSSGFNSQGVIDSLVAVSRAPVGALERRKSAASRQLTIVNDLLAKLQSLKTRSEGLGSAADLRSLAVTASDETRVRATVSSAAAVGAHAVSVGQLAQAQTSRSRAFNQNQAGVAGTGSVKITVGADPGVTVAFGIGDTLGDLAARINTAAPRVNASVLFTGVEYHLVIAGKDTGAANAIAFVEAGDPLNLVSTLPAQDAQLTVDGLAMTRPSNLVSDAFPGLTFELRAVTAAPVAVTVANDPAGLKARLQGLVDDYNEAAKTIAGQLRFGGSSAARSDGSTLFGDGTVTNLQRRLGLVMGTSYGDGTAGYNAAMLGITQNRDGTLAFNAAKLSSAIAADPLEAQRLLVGGNGNSGLASALSSLVSEYTAASTGLLAAKQGGVNRQIKAFDEQIARVEDTAASLQTRLQRQFTQLDRVMSGLQAQTAYLTQLFGSKG